MSQIQMFINELAKGIAGVWVDLRGRRFFMGTWTQGVALGWYGLRFQRIQCERQRPGGRRQWINCLRHEGGNPNSEL